MFMSFSFKLNMIHTNEVCTEPLQCELSNVYKQSIAWGTHSKYSTGIIASEYTKHNINGRCKEERFQYSRTTKGVTSTSNSFALPQYNLYDFSLTVDIYS